MLDTLQDTLRIVPLSRHIGAEVKGIDASRPVPDDAHRAVRAGAAPALRDRSGADDRRAEEPAALHVTECELHERDAQDPCSDGRRQQPSGPQHYKHIEAQRRHVRRRGSGRAQRCPDPPEDGSDAELRCHHCGHREPKPETCPECGSAFPGRPSSRRPVSPIQRRSSIRQWRIPIS